VTTSAAHLLDVARAEIGQGESPRGSNLTKYGAWFGVNPTAWCSMFVSWVANMAGAPELVAFRGHPKGSYYSGDILDLYAARGRVSMTPQVGDFVVWDWPGVGTQNDHIGIVEVLYSGGRIGTIEGNSPGSGYAYDVVGRHTRDAFRSVRGFCHPAYSGVAPTPSSAPLPPPPVAVQEVEMSLFVRGDAGPIVYELAEGRPPRNIKSPATLADLAFLGFGHSVIPAGTRVETINGVKVIVVAQRFIDELL
jgi:hypothetical protein